MVTNVEAPIFCSAHKEVHNTGCPECRSKLDARVHYYNRTCKSLLEELEQMKKLHDLHEKHLDEAFDKNEDLREVIRLLSKQL